MRTLLQAEKNLQFVSINWLMKKLCKELRELTTCVLDFSASEVDPCLTASFA